MQKNKKTIVFGIFTNYFQYVLNILLGIFLSPLVLKYAGQETMGAYAILLQVISYVGLVDLGIGFSASRFISQSYAVSYEEFEKTSNMFRSVGIIQNMIMATLFIILSLFIQDIFHFSNHLTFQMKIGLWCLATWTVISSPWSMYTGVLYTLNHLAQQNIIDAITNFVKIILAIVFVILGWSIIGLIASQIISSFIGFILKYIYTNRKIGKIKFSFSLKLNAKFKEILFFSFKGFLITIAIKLVFSTDNLIVGSLFGPVAVSIYYLTFQPGNMLNQFILKITDNFTPSINMWYAKREMDKLRTSFLYLFRITFFLTVLMIWGIVFCTESIINLWVGKENYLAQPMALWCGLLAGSIVLGHVPNAFVMAVGKIKTLSYFALFEGFLNLSLSLVLGKTIGMHGIMLATLIANIPSCIYLFYKGTKLLEFKREFLTELLQWKYLVSFLFIPFFWVSLKKICVENNLLQKNDLLLSAILVMIIYPIAIFMMYNILVNENEKIKIKTIIQEKLGILKKIIIYE
jgi:O-antigen/teichoic acid export membrane protein